jgi:small subunit ribosomal protein S5
MVVGDRKGAVGVGLGKAGDTAAAIDKAVRAAKKNVIRIPLTKNKSLRHDVSAKFGSSEIVLYPAVGRGLVAGSSLRTVLELAGITDVTGKVLSRSKNKVNNARAAVEALKTLI